MKTPTQIQRLKIDDYQSIDTAVIELGRFTVLVGPSSTGKSAVLRALRLAFRNASGTGFVRSGQKSTKVRVVWGEDPLEMVEVRKGKGVSEFYTASAQFSKCGTTVPEPVEAILNVGDESLSTQHDSPYMLAQSGSQVAAIFGELTGAAVIQSGSEVGQLYVRLAKLKVTELEADIESKQADKAALPDEEAIRVKYEKAHRLTVHAALGVRIAELVSRIEVVQARANVPKLPEPPSGAEIERLMQAALSLRSMVSKASQIDTVIDTLTNGAQEWAERRDALEEELGVVYGEADICDHCPLRGEMANA